MTRQMTHQNEAAGELTMPSRAAEQAMTAAAIARKTQEVQAAMTVAKRFPRDESSSLTRILTACKRQGLAESAMYAYPRGDQTVTGPSIRLAETLAQAWGNLDFGVEEIEQRTGESTVMAFCWDLETNVRRQFIFQQPHVRYTKKGGNIKLTDPRDIYEMVANQAARRLRACILAIIPGDIVDQAVAACEATLKGGGAVPLIDRVRKMLTAFAELGVSQGMIEKRLNHKIEVTSENELVLLRKIYKAVDDGHSKREDYFEVAAAGGDVSERLEKANGAAKPAEPEKTAETPKTGEALPVPVTPPLQQPAGTLFPEASAKDKPAEPAKPAASAQPVTAAADEGDMVDVESGLGDLIDSSVTKAALANVGAKMKQRAEEFGAAWAPYAARLDAAYKAKYKTLAK